MISKFSKQPHWFKVRPARVCRNLVGLSCYVVVREAADVSGIAIIKFDPDEFLPCLGAHLPVGVGPAHPGYLSVNHIFNTTRYRVMLEYLEDYPIPQMLWEQEGHPAWVKEVKYR